MKTEKRLLVALAFSFIILAVWSNFAVKPRNSANTQVYPQAVEKPMPAESVELPKIVQPSPTPAAIFEFTQGKKKYIFSEPLGVIKEAIFANYKAYSFDLKNNLQVGDNALNFERGKVTTDSVTYIYKDSEKQITKKFTFSPDGYCFDFLLTVENLSSSELAFQMPLALGTLNPSLSKDKMAYHDVTVFDSEKPNYPNFQKPATFNHLKYIALRDRYFCAIIEPQKLDATGFITKISPTESEIGLFVPELKIVPRGTLEQRFKVYIGPQDARTLRSLNSDWQAVIYFGKLDIIAQGLIFLLDLLYNFGHNWGLAIVLLSLVVYLILFPLTVKQMKSMKEMQLLQPKIENLRVSYKDNPQRLNKEIMELYRKHKVNPFGGCLPMLLQIPIFFALYQVLIRSIALKGAGFLWIKDLSEPDKLITFPTNIPLIGNEFNILPILMALEMFFQQKSSMANISSAQAEQQKIMLIVMPVMFGFLFYHMPSGLVLYWFINSSLALIYQLRVGAGWALKNVE